MLIACLRMTVPLPARGSGRAGSVTKIICLNTRANAGALRFDSSTTGLYDVYQSLRLQREENGRIIPYSVSEIGYRGRVIDVNEILRTRFDQYPAVVLPMSKHDSTEGQGT